jgi:ACS family glucarate transporter-like MFS transporter
MSALMFLMGMFQGPMSPVGSQLNRNWMPRGGGAGGVERAWAQRFVSLSHNICPLLAALFTPRIAERYGWRAVCYIFSGVGGAFLILWRLLAANKPAAVRVPALHYTSACCAAAHTLLNTE